MADAMLEHLLFLFCFDDKLCYFPLYYNVFFEIAAATGDMPTYQIRTPTTALPQGVVMAASPGTLHSPQQLAEEATRKRELRLMKNRYQLEFQLIVKSLFPRISGKDIDNPKILLATV